MISVWFAWYPVQLGALSTGKWAWCKHVLKIKGCGVTLYQDISLKDSL